MLRRYRGGEGESFSRRVGYDFKVEISKSHRAQCRSCKKKIPKGVVRFALMMQDEEGYKSAHWQHECCFWKHKDVARHLNGLHELHGHQLLDQELQQNIKEKYCNLRGLNVQTSTAGDGNDNDGDNDGMNRNALIAQGLYDKAEQVRKEKPRSVFASKAWQKGARIIELHPVPITCREDASSLKGIGKKIADEIESILATLNAPDGGEDPNEAEAEAEAEADDEPNDNDAEEEKQQQQQQQDDKEGNEAPEANIEEVSPKKRSRTPPRGKRYGRRQTRQGGDGENDVKDGDEDENSKLAGLQEAKEEAKDQQANTEPRDTVQDQEQDGMDVETTNEKEPIDEEQLDKDKEMDNDAAERQEATKEEGKDIQANTKQKDNLQNQEEDEMDGETTKDKASSKQEEPMEEEERDKDKETDDDDAERQQEAEARQDNKNDAGPPPRRQKAVAVTAEQEKKTVTTTTGGWISKRSRKRKR